MYSATVNVKGIVGYVGGSNAEDLAQGVKACTETMESYAEAIVNALMDTEDEDECDNCGCPCGECCCTEGDPIWIAD